MIWQDILISIANIIFGYSLAFQVYKGFKDKKKYLTLQTSSLTAIGLFMLSISFFTLNLIYSTIIALFNGTMWFLLFLQGLIYRD
ncbi:MAG: hypothetical protein Q7S27_03725 [Nanoarchaeota archaeon]|nr:hypothetical protein [Nanoarchaeota archaeon]